MIFCHIHLIMIIQMAEIPATPVVFQLATAAPKAPIFDFTGAGMPPAPMNEPLMELRSGQIRHNAYAYGQSNKDFKLQCGLRGDCSRSRRSCVADDRAGGGRGGGCRFSSVRNLAEANEGKKAVGCRYTYIRTGVRAGRGPLARQCNMFNQEGRAGAAA